MFKSKLRAINVPQSEHQRLSGIVAMLWGNADFDRPALDFDAFVAGVALHDSAYGAVDNYPLLEMPRADWLNVARRGAETRYQHPVTDVVVKRHIMRLAGYDLTPDKEALIADCERMITVRLNEVGIDRPLLEWADPITHLCDNIAFDFSFEAPTTGGVAVHPHTDSDENVKVTYTLEAGGVITLDPWPLRVDAVEGYILGYERDGYPERLAQVMLPYTLKPAD